MTEFPIKKNRPISIMKQEGHCMGVTNIASHCLKKI